MIRNFLMYCVSFIALPHYLCYRIASKEVRFLINSDLSIFNNRRGGKQGLAIVLFSNRYYRNIFYSRLRMNSIITKMLRILLPSYDTFDCNTKEIGECIRFSHPFATILNAKSIGKNFSFRNNLTIGNKIDGAVDDIPTIGDNVYVGANVVIIGKITIGNNVTIGAGSVVVKDVPSNCVIAGNPAKIIKRLQNLK